MARNLKGHDRKFLIDHNMSQMRKCMDTASNYLFLLSTVLSISIGAAVVIIASLFKIVLCYPEISIIIGVLIFFLLWFFFFRKWYKEMTLWRGGSLAYAIQAERHYKNLFGKNSKKEESLKEFVRRHLDYLDRRQKKRLRKYCRQHKIFKGKDSKKRPINTDIQGLDGEIVGFIRLKFEK